MPEDRSPVLASHGESPASASDPHRDLEDGRWHIYEPNPVPWWVALLWVAFFAFAVIYLIRNLVAE